MLPSPSVPPPHLAMAPSPTPLAMVYFATGNGTLSVDLMATLQHVAANFRGAASHGDTHGHIETLGAQLQMPRHSAHRAVRNALVRGGVPSAAIAGGGQGEASLAVQTADSRRAA